MTQLGENVVVVCGACGDRRERDVMTWDAECNYPGPFCKKCDSPDLRRVPPKEQH